MAKRDLGSDVIEKYKKYRNTETKFKAFKMNQQIFDIDDIYEPQAISTPAFIQWAKELMGWWLQHLTSPSIRWWALRR